MSSRIPIKSHCHALPIAASVLLAAAAAAPAADYVFLDHFETDTQCVDADADGWTLCERDCCDAPGECAPHDPALVNPGAFDFAGNGIDEDCDLGIDEVDASCDMALASNSSQPLDHARALGLCSFTVESPLQQERVWGVIAASFHRADGTGTPAANSRSLRSGFGTNVAPLEGGRISVLSTGVAAAQAAPNNTSPSWVIAQSGADMGTSSALPADWIAFHANAPPVAPDCPSAQSPTTATDPIMLKLRIRVPTNAASFSTSLNLYASEYPEWVCSPYVDYLLVLLDSAFVAGVGQDANPADKNLAFYDPEPPGPPHLPLGSNLAYGNTGLFRQCKNGTIGCASGAVISTTTACLSNTGLTGTGFDPLNPAGDPGYCGTNNQLGGATGWLTVSGNVVPGETIELRFLIWDVGDMLYDSTVLLDQFRWAQAPTTPGTQL